MALTLLALFHIELKNNIGKVVQITAAILITLAFSIGQTSHVVSTFMAVFGSALLIMAGAYPSALSRILGATKLQFVGKLSYSLYLWHWPIICFAIWTVGINWVSIPFILVLTLLFSLLSYYFVEEPARRSGWYSPGGNLVLGLFVLGLSISIISIMQTLNFPKFTGTESGAIEGVGFQPGRGVTLYTKRQIENCMGELIANDKSAASHALNNCTAELKSGPRFVFFGDSHSLDMFGVGELLFQMGVGTVINFGQPGCHAPQTDNEPEYCDYINTVMSIIPPLAKGQTGFIVLRNNIYPRSVDGSLASYLGKLESFYHEVNQLGYKMVYVANGVSFPALADGGLCSEQWFRPKWALSDKCSMGMTVSYEEQIGRRRDFFDSLKILEGKHKDFLVFDPIQTFCNPKDNICVATKNGAPLFRDNTHLTLAGGVLLGTDFLNFLKSEQYLIGPDS